ncbi:hypothetical protein EV663_101532 [Rhodovulum bhavnagarense]|uniref:Uncharacterized protein n=1 Tax=Rhodovulum bhavnagarense TaxID=992286 RepID=A0A4R2RK35_9RHOB|nr:hypothetical protein [Rhodovulum bhavnagarense]TCP63264.1 hypothetical protein EV663_101532 [Rhodovulum bhavnagarense]
MLRARLWYGPTGHELSLDRVARYLRGPLACEVRSAQHRHTEGWVAQLDLRGPVSAALEIARDPQVAADADALARRLPSDVPPRLAERLAGCTARLEIYDALGAPPFLPATTMARSVLFPLAYGMDGYVEDVETGRLFYYPQPGDITAPNPLRRALEALITVLRR